MQILGNVTKIGAFDLSTHVMDLSVDQEYRYVIEVTADERQRVGQYFPIHELRKVLPADLPNDFYLSIESIDSQCTQFRNLRYLTLTKKQDTTRLCALVSFEHWDWHLPENLHLFAERFVKTLKQSADLSIDATFDREDVGVSVLATVSAQSNQNLYATFLQLAASTLGAYRATLAQGYSTPSESAPRKPTEVKSTPQIGDSHGPRWWIRYVAVPILGSGTVAAAIAGMLALLK